MCCGCGVTLHSRQKIFRLPLSEFFGSVPAHVLKRKDKLQIVRCGKNHARVHPRVYATIANKPCETTYATQLGKTTKKTLSIVEPVTCSIEIVRTKSLT